MNRRLIVAIGCRVLIAAVFLAAGLPKILDPAGFSLSVFRYQMLPDDLINLTAIFLPWVEVVAAILLLFSPRLRDAAAGILLVLLVVFTVAITINILRGIDVGCGCFTTDPRASRIGWSKVGSNVCLIAAAAAALMTSRQPRSARQ